MLICLTEIICFFFSLIFLISFALFIFVLLLSCLIIYDVYLLCELYLFSLKTFIFCFIKKKELHYVAEMEKAMVPHSSTLAWKIPWTEEPGRLQSMGSLRVRHDWATSLSLFTFIHWRRKWQPTPVFSPGESQGLGSLVGCRLWVRTESDTTEVT